jgi:flagellar hook protein FlgE
MLRSLFNGVAGVNAQQTYLDVISNNISNVNTTGYKASRLTFAETFASTLAGATGGNGTQGSTNPMQIGLGVKPSAISTDFTQGTLSSTGITTDLGISGDGFFVVSNGDQNYYTRSGAFDISDEGYLLGTGGTTLQGRVADANGTIGSSTELEDIVLPYGKKDPAQATENVTLFCNLNQNASSLEEWVAESKLSLATGSGSVTTDTRLDALKNFDIDANSSPIQITGTDRNGNAITASFDFGTTGTTVGDLINTINTAFGSGTTDGATMSLDANGYLRLKANSFGETQFSFGMTAPTATSATAATNTAANAYTVGGTAASLTTDLATLDGVTMADGDTITITGTNPDGTAVSTTFTYGAANNGTTVQDLLNRIAGTGGFSNVTASLDTSGHIVLTDSTTGSGSQTTLAIADGTATGFANTFTAVDGLDATNVAMPSFSQETAGSTGTHSTSITVYDSLGNSHELEIKFTQDSTPGANSWKWEAVVDGGDTVPTSGGTGTVSFNDDGSLKTFVFDNNATALKFNAAGTQETSINFKPGTIGGTDGMTQYASASTTTAIEQDGFTVGVLNNVSVGKDGIITGSYSNGKSRTLAQVALATFDNEGGLVKEGDSLWAASAASGNARTEWAGTNNTTKIQSGYLEGSNVDLTSELTSMIVAERALQANAKVVSTADNVLMTIIERLKRS